MVIFDEKNPGAVFRERRRGPRVARSAAARFAIDLVADVTDNTDGSSYIPVPPAAQRPYASVASRSIIDIIEEDNESYNNADNDVITIEKSDPNERHEISKDVFEQNQSRRKRPRNNDVIDLENDTKAPFDIYGTRKRDNRTAFDIDDDESITVVDKDVEVIQNARRPEFIILDVFPDVDLDYVKQLLLNNNQDTTIVIQCIAGDPKYPKSDVASRTANLDLSASIIVQEDVVADKYDFMSSQSFIPDPKYITEASNRLLLDFPFLSKVGVKTLLKGSHNHYAICHDKVLTTVKVIAPNSGETGSNKGSIAYQQVLAALGAHPLSLLQKSAFDKLLFEFTGKSYKKSIAILQKPRKRHHDISSLPEFTITHPILQDEVLFVDTKLKEWLGGMKQQVDRRARQIVAQLEKKAFVCACCFDSYHWEDLIPCQNVDTVENPHMFCADCICNMLKSKIFGDGNLGYDKATKELAIDLQCFHGDGCTFSFHQSSLTKVVPAALMKKYEELQFQLSLSKAGIATVHGCPKCGFKCDVPETQNVFSCPVSNCLYESCRLCGEASHIPLRCDEVVKDRVETAGRTTVEEAITAAKIRECPTCKKNFIKSDGCNKIRCGCGAFICYVCRKKISDYSHFCQTPHCDHSKCTKCALYTDAEQDDLRAMREAGLHAAEQHKEANIDVEQIIAAKPVAAIGPVRA
jgi:hypothetical protein